MKRIIPLIASILLLVTAGHCADPAESNFTLYVSNQSMDIQVVDIKIYLDGKPVIDEKFDVNGRGVPQHNWKAFYFYLPNGPHVIRAQTNKGKAVLEQEFVLQDKNWAVLDYWYNSELERQGSKSGKRQFAFMIQDRPIGFQ